MTRGNHLDLAAILAGLVAQDHVPDLSALLWEFDERLRRLPEEGSERAWCAVSFWALWELDAMGCYRSVAARLEPHRVAVEHVAARYPAAVLWQMARCAGRYLGSTYDPWRAWCMLVESLRAFADVEPAGYGVCACFGSALAQELGCYEQAAELAQEVVLERVPASLHYVLHARHAYALIAETRYDEAASVILRARSLARGAPVTDRGRIETACGVLELARGQFEDAEETLALATRCLGRVPAEQADALLRRADALHALGEWQRAERVLEDAEDSLSELSAAGYLGPLPKRAALVRAELSLVLDRFEAAGSAHERACALRDAVAERIGDPAVRAAFLERETDNLRIQALGERLQCMIH